MTATPADIEPLAETAHAEPPSVLVLARDDEGAIEGCLRSLPFSDDIVVLDGGSTDRTVALAEAFPHVRVFHRTVQSEADQRNWALRQIEFRHPWVLLCHADELVPPALRDAVRAALRERSQDQVAYRVRRRTVFRGRVLRYGDALRERAVRLLRPEKVSFEDRPEGVHPLVDGRVGELIAELHHLPLANGYVQWFHRQNQASRQRATELEQLLREPVGPQFRELFSTESSRRNRAAAAIALRLKLRGLVRFLHLYILRLGFLDGDAGLHHAALVATADYWTAIKVRERRKAWIDQTDRLAQRLLAEGP